MPNNNDFDSLQEQWEREVKRLKQVVRRHKKQGYSIPKGFTDKFTEKPTLKRLEKLQNLTPKKAILEYERISKQELKKPSNYSKKKHQQAQIELSREEQRISNNTHASSGVSSDPDEDEVLDEALSIIERIYTLLNTFEPSTRLGRYHRTHMLYALDGAIDQVGEEDLAIAMRDHPFAYDAAQGAMEGSDQEYMTYNYERFQVALLDAIYAANTGGNDGTSSGSPSDYSPSEDLFGGY